MSETFEQLRDLYQETVLTRSRTPQHAGRIADADGEGRGDNPMCGDRVSVTVRRGAGGAIEAVAFDGRGCAICLASADLMCEAVLGRQEPAIGTLDAGLRRMVRPDGHDEDAPEALRPLSGVREFPSRVRCVTLAWDALASALAPGEAR